MWKVQSKKTIIFCCRLVFINVNLILTFYICVALNATEMHTNQQTLAAWMVIDPPSTST